MRRKTFMAGYSRQAECMKINYTFFFFSTIWLKNTVIFYAESESAAILLYVAIYTYFLVFLTFFCKPYLAGIESQPKMACKFVLSNLKNLHTRANFGILYHPKQDSRNTKVSNVLLVYYEKFWFTQIEIGLQIIKPSVFKLLNNEKILAKERSV